MPETKTSSAGIPTVMSDTQFQRMLFSNDLVPNGAGTIIIQKVNADGSLGDYAKSFKNLLISSNVSSPTETEELETGQGPNITMVTSVSYNLEVVVNVYSPLFHALMGGKDTAYGEARVPQETDIVIKKTGTDPNFKYTYSFPVGSEPVADANGNYGIYLFDAREQSLQEVTDAGATLTDGQFRYNVTDKTLEVSSSYENESMEMIYFVTKSNVFSEKSPETVATPTFHIKMMSSFKVVSTGEILTRYQTISRGGISGDLPEPPNQKSISTNMTYSLASQTPAIGEREYEAFIYKKS